MLILDSTQLYTTAAQTNSKRRRPENRQGSHPKFPKLPHPSALPQRKRRQALRCDNAEKAQLFQGTACLCSPSQGRAARLRNAGKTKERCRKHAGTSKQQINGVWWAAGRGWTCLESAEICLILSKELPKMLFD